MVRLDACVNAMKECKMQECECESLYEHQQFDACIQANGMEPERFNKEQTRFPEGAEL